MVSATLLAGGAFGVKHALEADHVAAVGALLFAEVAGLAVPF